MKHMATAVAYENDEVVQVGIAPSNVSEDQFIQTYNEPDERKPTN